MPRVFLIRHGQSTSNLAGAIANDQSPLPAEGEAQSKDAGSSLAALNLIKPVFVVSPFKRTRQTADHIISRFGKPYKIIISPEIRERDFGPEFIGKAADTLGKQLGYMIKSSDGSRMILNPKLVPPGGESLEMVQRRAAPALAAAIKDHHGSDLVVVSHGHTLRALQAHIVGSWEAGRNIKNAQILQFDTKQITDRHIDETIEQVSTPSKYLSNYDSLLRDISKFTGMKNYLVGGAVRDAIIGRPSKDIDLVVVGGIDKLESLGFTKIKKDFPVFTHPSYRGVEVAVARGEKKSGQGHSGFMWHVAPDLETDLARRDLTINSIAYHPANGIIDPHGGASDIEAKQLRPVSKAFGDDPLRTFRAARFAAQLGFTMHPDLVREIARTVPELPSEPKDRVRDELNKAMKSPHPRLFFDSLRKAGALGYWFPEVAKLAKKASVIPYAGGSAYDHTMSALQYSASNKTTDSKTPWFLLTQQMHSDIGNFTGRLGLPTQANKEYDTHSKHLLSLFSPRLPSTQAVDYWRKVRAIATPHLEAATASHKVMDNNHALASNIGHYTTLFDRLKNTSIPSGSDKDAALKHLNSTAYDLIGEALIISSAIICETKL